MHTPTPWKLVKLNSFTIDGKLNHNFAITLGDDRRTKIALLGSRKEANGNFIVKACNEYYENKRKADANAALLEIAKYAKRVMDTLEKHGASIVPHLLDTDDNDGQRLREALETAGVKS